MADPVFIEQDPEPDIADPNHTTKSQSNNNRHSTDTPATPHAHPKPLDPVDIGTPSSTHTIEHVEKDGLLGPLHHGETANPHVVPRKHERWPTPESVLGLAVNQPEPEVKPEDAPGLTEPVEDKEEPFPNVTWKESMMNTIKNCKIICLLPVLIPVAWALEFSHQGDVAIFVSNLLAIVPLAGAIAFATEEIALRIGEVYGGLLNATFGNAVELLIAIIALVNGQIDIVQASMIGSILSNLLLVLGCSYFAGGLRFHEQMYAIPNAQMQIGLLGITLLAVALPSGYHWAYPNTVGVDAIPTGAAPTGEELQDLLKMSRGISFILLACYAMFLMFQLYTHAYLFRVPREKQTHPLPGPTPTSASVFPKPNWVSSLGDSSSTSSRETGTLRRFRRWSIRSRSEAVEIDLEQQPTHMTMDPPARRPRFSEPPLTTAAIRRLEQENDPRQLPSTKLAYACVLLTIVTVLAGVTAEFLVGSIDGLTSTAGISREFVGLILLPVIGNSVEHITAVTVSVKDKLNLSMSIAIGSSIQVSLCILPVLVLIAWPLGQPLTLYFDAFETVTLVVAVLLVNFAISDGRTNYLEGFTMMMAYVAIALVCWFYDPIR